MRVRPSVVRKKTWKDDPRVRWGAVLLLLSLGFLGLRYTPDAPREKESLDLPHVRESGLRQSGRDGPRDARASSLDVRPVLGTHPEAGPEGIRAAPGGGPEVFGLFGSKRTSRLESLSGLFKDRQRRSRVSGVGADARSPGEPDTFVDGVYYPEERPAWAMYRGDARPTSNDPAVLRSYREALSSAGAAVKTPSSGISAAAPAAPAAAAAKPVSGTDVPGARRARKPRQKKDRPKLKPIEMPTAPRSGVSSKASSSPRGR